MFQQYHSVPTQVDAVQVTKNNKDQVFNLYGDGDVAIGDWVKSSPSHILLSGTRWSRPGNNNRPEMPINW